MKYFIEGLKKWRDFSGKTDRKSFWMFFLIFNLLVIPFGIVGKLINIGNLSKIYMLLTFIPFIAIGFRRLNDTGKNRFLFLIPIVNLILAAEPSKEK
ncbi:MAG: DUF805 domain-containing protein [Polaribacter sp.]|jgi:uncharacterized membrane protein YhaH (DUF805 family)|nr:DUF805 domain-containing protein [Polaribacter sp.]